MPEEPCQITIKFSRTKDEKIIKWIEALKSSHVNRSAVIKEILLAHIDGGSTEERLDRIEALLKSGEFGPVTKLSEDDFFDDLILDNSDL